MTHGAVRCSAWLGVAAVVIWFRGGSAKSQILAFDRGPNGLESFGWFAALRQVADEARPLDLPVVCEALWLKVGKKCWDVVNMVRMGEDKFGVIALGANEDECVAK